MQFYCPVCIKTVELNAETTLTTKQNRCVFKASCPTCQQDLACLNPEQTAVTNNASGPVINEVDPQEVVDQALNEFDSSAV